MLQPRLTNAATLAGCPFNQCRLFTELNNAGGCHPHPLLALGFRRSDVQKVLLELPPTPSPHLQGQVMRIHHSERGGGPEDLGGGGPSLLKAFGKQRGPEPAVQYHFPQKLPADSGTKGGRGAPYHP